MAGQGLRSNSPNPAAVAIAQGLRLNSPNPAAVGIAPSAPLYPPPYDQFCGVERSPPPPAPPPPIPPPPQFNVIKCQSCHSCATR